VPNDLPKITEGELLARDLRFMIVAARFNDFVVEPLLRGALDALKRHGVVLEHGINHPPSNKAKAGSTSIQVMDPDGFHVTLSPKK